jgi:DNA polymerase III delta subunit
VEIIKEDAFRKLVKKGLSGGYLFFGDEDYMKTYSVNAARSAVCADESFSMFNDMKIDVRDYSADALLDPLTPMPMMADKKLVTVNGLNVNGLRAKDIDDLCDVLATLPEYDYNVLIISVPATMIEEGNLPKYPSNVLKRLGEYLTLVQFEPVTGARLVNWVGKHFAHHGTEATPEVCSFLINYAGRSMYTLANETQKLSYYALSHGRNNVTRDDVLNVSVAEISTDAFTLANAIVDGRGEDAISALAAMKFRRVDPIILLGEVSRVVCDLFSIKALADEGCSVSEIAHTLRMNEYRAKIYAQGASGRSMQRMREILDMCAQADLSMKRSSQPGYTVIEKFICSI